MTQSKISVLLFPHIVLCSTTSVYFVQFISCIGIDMFCKGRTKGTSNQRIRKTLFLCNNGKKRKCKFTSANKKKLRIDVVHNYDYRKLR